MTKLRELRKQKGWSLTRLTAMTLIAPSDICQVELGQRTCFPSWRKRLARAFQVTEKELFGDDIVEQSKDN